MSPPLRRATGLDAPQVAELVNMAGDGLPLYFWAQWARPNQSAWEVGRERVGRAIEGFAEREIVVYECDGKVAACLMGRPLGSAPAPPGDEALSILAPLLELQNMESGTWYIDVLATFPEYRARGFGAALLSVAEHLARERRMSRISLIVSDVNVMAQRLYGKSGYSAMARRPIVKENWKPDGKEWVLLAKDL
jgi:ribosomal protein S18 acetylase RimI-like enzyme